MNIFLIGYRGTGKTTVGRLLAERLGWTSTDSDAEIVAATGMSISDIFALQGEATFREIEEKAVAMLAATDRTVVSLGGGAILSEESRRLLAERGFVVWLKAPPEQIAVRLTADAASADQRPPLTDKSQEEEIRHVLQERTPLYRQCADLQVDTQNKTPSAVVEAIFSAIAGRLNS